MSPARAPALARPATAADPPGVPGVGNVAVLVVGENPKTRTLLASILGAFGVGVVLRAVSGAKALELFHRMRRQPERIGVAGLDLVMADWEMTGIGGAGLLRWIRRHRDSPDPFLPFIAMGMAPSAAQVGAARDLGASQFIAWPFTIETLCGHLDSLTGDRRNYVQIRGYFGPDRRHRDVPVALELRGDDAVNRPGVRLLVAPRRLAAKLGGRFEPQAARLAEAQQTLRAWRQEFVETIEGDLARAESRFAQIERTDDAAARARGLADLNRISHHLHGYGRSFGSPLVITLSRSLRQLTGRQLTGRQLTGQIDRVDSGTLELVRAHLDALQAALKAGLRSEGGKVGRKLVHALHRANRKIVDRAPDRQLLGAG